MALPSRPTHVLPDAENSELDRIDGLFAEMRDRRDALMRRLSDLQRRCDARPDPGLFVDLTEARLHLGALLARWRELLGRALALGKWAPLGSEPPIFEEVRGGERFRAARASVPLTADGLMFVHGPVVLWHAAVLAEQMLDGGDRLVRLNRGAFHRELAVEPVIVVWDTRSPAPAGHDVREAAVEGSFATAEGRELAFAALPATGRRPARRAGWHPMAARIIAEAPPRLAEPAAFGFVLTPSHCPEAGTLDRGSAVLLAKLEAVMTVFTQHLAVGERLVLLSRVLNFGIDADLGGWLAGRPEIRFELDWKRQRAIPGRGSFVPMRYRIGRDEPGWQRGMFVCLDSHCLDGHVGF